MPIIASLFIALFTTLPGCIASSHAVSQARDRTTCGETRLLQVRFLDGSPVSHIRVVLIPASEAMGGPEAFPQNSSGDSTEENMSEQSAHYHAGPVNIASLTPETACSPVFTGPLITVTDAQGFARFERLSAGNWVLHFEGTIAHGGHNAPLISSSIQGRYPYGRSRNGGGFIERVDPFNEDGGSDAQPIGSSTGATTSRYLLLFSEKDHVWLPGLDLTSADEEAPQPLADVTPVSIQPAAPSEFQYDSTFSAPYSPPEPALGASVVLPQGEHLAVQEVAGKEGEEGLGSAEVQGHEFNFALITWLALLCLMFGGLVALGWGKSAFQFERRRALRDMEDTRNSKGIEGN